MSLHQCPFCRHLNVAAARRCAACNADLSGVEAPAASRRLASAGAIWLDDLAAPDTTPDPPEAAVAAERRSEHADFAITLRDVAAVAQPELPARPPAPAHAAAGSLLFPVGGELVASGPVRAPTASELQAARIAADKTAHRAAVRRERLRAPGSRPAPAPAVSDVLVVEADAGARELLTGLLRGFGFTVHPHRDVAAAAAWMHRRKALTAAFFDLPADAGRAEATLALCKSIRGRPGLNEGALPPVLVLVAATLRPVDRVRAELAGCDATIAKPVTRGSVAGVLDARGVALPADARRR